MGDHLRDLTAALDEAGSELDRVAEELAQANARQHAALFKVRIARTAVEDEKEAHRRERIKAVRDVRALDTAVIRQAEDGLRAWEKQFPNPGTAEQDGGKYCRTKLGVEGNLLLRVAREDLETNVALAADPEAAVAEWRKRFEPKLQELKDHLADGTNVSPEVPVPWGVKGPVITVTRDGRTAEQPRPLYAGF
jgi:hypothetical protein